MENWTFNVFGIMHTNHITQKEIANKMSLSKDYINMVLNGHRKMPNAEQRIMSAIDEIISERI